MLRNAGVGVLVLALAAGACERSSPTAVQSSSTTRPAAAISVSLTFLDFYVCSNGADGTYTVALQGGAPGAPVTVTNGNCAVVYHYPSLIHSPGDTLVTVTYQTAAGITLDSIVKDSIGGASPTAFPHLYTGTNTVSQVVNNDAGATAIFYLTPTPPPPPPPTGCTGTIGFWKNHAGFGPQADLVTPLLPIWLGTSGGALSVQVTTATQAVFLLSMSNNPSNPVDKLYAQLLGAKLSIASGADPSAVASIITAADAFLATHNDASTLTAAQKATVLGWASALADYNAGVTGPGECTT